MWICVCESVFMLSWTYGVMLGCVYLHQCVCLCARLYGKSEPAVASGSIDRRLCATHVKFMYCAALTKELWNGFWGKIMPEQREDRTEENKTDETTIRRRKGESAFEERKKKSENDPPGQSKG